MFNDVKDGIFSELRTGGQVDPYRRTLQRTYIDEMEELMDMEEAKYSQTDIQAVARGTLRNLEREVKGGINRQVDVMSKYHLEDLSERISKILYKDNLRN